MRIRLKSESLRRIWWFDVGDVLDESTMFIKGKVAAFLRSQYARVPDLEMCLVNAAGVVVKTVIKREPKVG
ncbi:MAG: hypothetical protein HYY18_21985 [Planctomycetes bacterium]|nr:hypothetical protein [Planctomycetota bacterium]